MGPLKRNERKQLSMLHFTKRNAVTPDPGSQPAPRNQTTKPLRATPHPTAPPFFEQPMPKPPHPRHSLTISDDAWEAADRFMKGQRLTPKKRAFEEHAPVMKDSDDDFEPDVVTQRISRARPSNVGKSSTSALRDDRASMTKRSASKPKRSQPVGCIPTQQHSVFEEYGLPPKMPSLCSSEEEEDNHVVVFDGEKSSLSGTDNEDGRTDEIVLGGGRPEPPTCEQDNDRAPRRHLDEDVLFITDEEPALGEDDSGLEVVDNEPVHRQKPFGRSPLHQENSLDSRAITPLRASQSRRNGEISLGSPARCTHRRDAISLTPENNKRDSSRDRSPVLDDADVRTRSSRGQVPRTVGRQKCSTSSQDLFETRLAEKSGKRGRKLRPLFDSDNEDSDSEEFVCRERRRRGGLKAPRQRRPDVDEGSSEGSRSTPKSRKIRPRSAKSNSVDESEGQSSRENSKLQLVSDIEIICTPKQARQTTNSLSNSPGKSRCHFHKASPKQLEGIGQSRSPHESPLRTPRNKRRDLRKTDPRRKSISEYIATASPSLSPPSKTKKRRRFGRLIIAESSESEEDVDGKEKDSGLIGKKTQNQISGQTLELSSETPKSAEWYQERNIDEFSESSCDTRPTPGSSLVASAVKRRKRRFTRGSQLIRKPLSVKRDISKSFDLSPDRIRTVTSPQIGRSTSQRGSPPLRRNESTKRSNAINTENVQPDVIDLVDEDEEPEIIPTDRDGSEKIEGSSFPGREDKISSASLDDDSPPPFNLIALCKDGESIRQMKERLGEEFVMDKVTEAQESGREIVGGEELGLTASYNKSVFDQFSKTVVADQLGKERAAKSVTEEALRGEYKFHYRGRERDSSTGKQRGSWRGNKFRGRFANYRRKRGSF